MLVDVAFDGRIVVRQEHRPTLHAAGLPVSKTASKSKCGEVRLASNRSVRTPSGTSSHSSSFNARMASRAASIRSCRVRGSLTASAIFSPPGIQFVLSHRRRTPPAWVPSGMGIQFVLESSTPHPAGMGSLLVG